MKKKIKWMQLVTQTEQVLRKRKCINSCSSYEQEVSVGLFLSEFCI